MLVLRIVALEKVSYSKAKSLTIRSSIYVVRGFDLLGVLFVNLFVNGAICFSEIKMLPPFYSTGECVLQYIIFKPK